MNDLVSLTSWQSSAVLQLSPHTILPLAELRLEDRSVLGTSKDSSSVIEASENVDLPIESTVLSTSYFVLYRLRHSK
jgi:hypothetical protein